MEERQQHTVTTPSELPPIEVRPIGVVQDAPDDLERLDWHDVESTIQLVGEAAAAADQLTLELEEYTHLIVLGWLDRYPEELRNRRTAYPGGDASLPLQGALALRGARPNPISFTVVELLEIEGDEIDVRGLPAILVQFARLPRPHYGLVLKRGPRATTRWSPTQIRVSQRTLVR